MTICFIYCVKPVRLVHPPWGPSACSYVRRCRLYGMACLPDPFRLSKLLPVSRFVVTMKEAQHEQPADVCLKMNSFPSSVLHQHWINYGRPSVFRL